MRCRDWWLPLLLLLSGCGINFTYSQTQPMPVSAPPSPHSGAVLSGAALTHTVQRGDTLYAIARRYRQTLANVAAWNQLQPPYTLYPNQVLRVSSAPAKSNPTPVAPQMLATPAPRDQAPIRQTAPSLTAYSAPSPRVNQTAADCAPQGQWFMPSQGRTEPTATLTGRRGINIFGQVNQPVIATASGQVIYSGTGVNGYASSLIIIQHSPTWLSIYSHTRNRRVSQGQQVRAGQAIADMGVDSRHRALLHFELSCAEKTVNPLLYLSPR